MLGEHRTTVRQEPDQPAAPALSVDAVPRLAEVLDATPGWRFLPADDLIDLVGDRRFPLVLADGTVAGVGEAAPDGHDPVGDLAVRTLVGLFDALVETERAAADALAAAAAARSEAVHDHLTGLLNRRGWERVLEHEEARAARRPSTWVIAVVDIDQLKETNDEGGHLAGDVLLKLAADTIAESVRVNDIVARVGGDEFAVLGLDYAPHRPEALVARIQRGLDGVDVSASVGAAVHRPDTALLETFRVADTVMYGRKAARKRGATTPT